MIVLPGKLNPRDMTGRVYGMLTCTHFVGRNTRGEFVWQFACSCGGALVSVGANVRCGRTVSCGCYGKTMRALANTTHGQAPRSGKTREYVGWTAMMSRCYNSNADNYCDYGGRGITVWEGWHSFESFFLWTGHKPENMSLERINNEIGYNPFNCKWATPTEQANNTRRNVGYAI